MSNRCWFRKEFLVLLATAQVASAAPGTLTFESVQDFDPTQSLGFYQMPAMMVGRDGQVYGSAGEQVFRIDNAGVFSTFYTSTRGPVSRIVVGNDGLLYAFTWQMLYSDGAPGAYHGELFRLDYQANYTSVLQLPHNVATDLVVGSDGAFYGGMGFECYDKSCNSVAGGIKITSAGTYNLLGFNQELMRPQVVGSDGALYGPTFKQWGVPSTASIFRLDTAGNLTKIHQMSDAEGFLDNLTLGSDGLIYAASQYSVGGGFGTLIRFDNLGTVSLQHQFLVTDGAYPAGGLTVGSDGAIYGLTESGGPSAAGSIYRVDTAGMFSTEHAFDWVDGGEPNQGMLLARDGALYGVTSSGSPNAAAYRVDTAGTTTYPVIPTGLSPATPLVQGSDCGLYGAAYYWDPAISNYKAKVYRLFEPGHLCQRIEFAPLPDRVLGDPCFTVDATASSTLPVSFAASGSCTVDGDEVTLNDVGLCALTASQAGDERFGPAEEITQVFTVPEPDRVASLCASCLLLGVLARRRRESMRGLTATDVLATGGRSQ